MVTEVDNEKNRFLLSLRSSDCHQENLGCGIQLLRSYIDEYKIIMDNLKQRKGS